MSENQSKKLVALLSHDANDDRSSVAFTIAAIVPARASLETSSDW